MPKVILGVQTDFGQKSNRRSLVSSNRGDYKTSCVLVCKTKDDIFLPHVSEAQEEFSVSSRQ